MSKPTKYRLLVEEVSANGNYQIDISNQILDKSKIKALFKGAPFKNVFAHVHGKSHAVVQLERHSGKFIKEWASETIAGNNLSIYPSLINKVVNNYPHSYSAGGFRRVKLEEYLRLNPKYESVTKR